MIQIFIVFIFSFLLVLFKIPLIAIFSSWFNLYDVADFYRKDHNSAVSRLGGVAIFSGFIMSLLLFVHAGEFTAVITALIILFLAGLIDDLFGNVEPAEKCFVQLMSAWILVVFGDCRITSFYGVLNVYELNELSGLLFSIALIIFLSNSFNLIDGINGLAGTIGLTVTIVFSVLLFIAGDIQMSLFAIAASGAIAGFLKYNYIPGRIFMGDSGSMFIGLISTILAIRFVEIDKSNMEISEFSVAPAISAILLIVPVFDAARVLLIRTLHGGSPFKGDRNHIHHRLKDLGLKDLQIVFVLTFFTIFMLAIVFFFYQLGNFNLILLSIVMCIVFNSLITYYKGKKTQKDYGFKQVLLRDTFDIK